MGAKPVRFTLNRGQPEAQEARFTAALATGLDLISRYFALEAIARKEPPMTESPMASRRVR
jgi:hypothetical protein